MRGVTKWDLVGNLMIRDVLVIEHLYRKVTDEVVGHALECQNSNMPIIYRQRFQRKDVQLEAEMKLNKVALEAMRGEAEPVIN